jgi:hypothetical protein
VVCEWFAARGSAAAPRVATQFVPQLRIGGVAALRVSAFSLWVGIDGGYRLGDATLAVPIARGLPAATVTASIGAIALAD